MYKNAKKENSFFIQETEDTQYSVWNYDGGVAFLLGNPTEFNKNKIVAKGKTYEEAYENFCDIPAKSTGITIQIPVHLKTPIYFIDKEKLKVRSAKFNLGHLDPFTGKLKKGYFLKKDDAEKRRDEIFAIAKRMI